MTIKDRFTSVVWVLSYRMEEARQRVRSAILSRTKAAIVFLALWGFIPAALATWLIQRGGMRDA